VRSLSDVSKFRNCSLTFLLCAAIPRKSVNSASWLSCLFLLTRGSPAVAVISCPSCLGYPGLDCMSGGCIITRSCSYSLSDCLKICDDGWREVSLHTSLHLCTVCRVNVIQKFSSFLFLLPPFLSPTVTSFPLPFILCGCYFVYCKWELPSIVQRT
jgi:hypothetical protein